MSQYHFSPYVSLVENRLIPSAIQYAIFHRFSGEMIAANETVRNLLRLGISIPLSDEDRSNPTRPPSLQQVRARAALCGSL